MGWSVVWKYNGVNERCLFIPTSSNQLMSMAKDKYIMLVVAYHRFTKLHERPQ